jgi:hypothetical protein
VQRRGCPALHTQTNIALSIGFPQVDALAVPGVGEGGRDVGSLADWASGGGLRGYPNRSDAGTLGALTAPCALQSARLPLLAINIRRGQGMRHSHKLVAMLACVAASAVLLGPVSTAFGRATIETYSQPISDGPFQVNDECVGLAGTFTGSGTLLVKLIITADDSHSHDATEVVRLSEDYCIDFPDGSYVLGSFVDHPVNQYDAYNGGVFGGTVQDNATLYDADGNEVGWERVRVAYHGTAENGIGTLQFEHVRVICH